MMMRHRLSVPFFVLCAALAPASAQAVIPDWCRALPRPEYKTIERIPVSNPWFEVYQPASGVFAIYEPHQSEETIGYLITGTTRAVSYTHLTLPTKRIV